MPLSQITKLMLFSGGGLPAISVSPSSWDFGATPVGTPVEKEFTISNPGTAALEITLPITIVGAEASAFTVTAQPGSTSLAPGASTTFTVQADADVIDSFNADISIVNNSSQNPKLVAINYSTLYIDNVLALGMTAFWPMNETSGVVTEEIIANMDGVYSGAALAQADFPLLGYNVPDFDGVNDFANLYSAAFASAFSMRQGFISVWLQNDNPGESGVSRYIFNIQRDANNFIALFKTATANQYFVRFLAGGTTKTITLNMTDATPIHLLIEWADAANGSYFRVRKNNVQVANETTGIGTVSGSGLSATQTVLGANSSSAVLPFDGKIGAFAYKASVASNANEQIQLSGGQ